MKHKLFPYGNARLLLIRLSWNLRISLELLSVIILFIITNGCRGAKSAGNVKVTLERQINSFSPLDSYSFETNDERNTFFPAELISVNTENPTLKIPLPGSRNVYVAYADETIYLASSEGYLGAFDGKTGKVIWKQITKNLPYYKVYVTPYFLAVSEGGGEVTRNGKLWFLDLKSGKVINRYDTTWRVEYFLQDDEYLYCVSRPLELTTYSLSTGERRNSTFLSFSPRGAMRSSGKLVLLSEGGVLLLVNAENLITEKVHLFNETVVSAPVLWKENLILLVNNRILAEDRNIVVFNLKDFTQSIKIPMSNFAEAAPVVEADTIYIATSDGRVAAYNITNGRNVWTTDILAPSVILALYTNRLLLWAQYLSETGLEKFNVPVEQHRFYSRKPEWADAKSDYSQALIILERANGKVSQVLSLPSSTLYFPLLPTPYHVLVHKFDEGIIGYDLELKLAPPTSIK